VQTSAVRSHVRISRAITAARASVTARTRASAGARYDPSDHTASPVSRARYYLRHRLAGGG